MKPLNEFMNQGVEGHVFPGGVLLVSKGSRILFHRGFGKVDMDSGRQVRKDTLYDLASLTKPLATAMAVLILIQQGRLFLKQPLGDVLPAAQHTDKAAITLEDLLCHRSGLPDHRHYYQMVVKSPVEKRRDHLRGLLLKEPLVYETGSLEIYSDLGFMLLAWVVETVSGSRLDHFIEQALYLPLDIRELFFIELMKHDLLVNNIGCRVAPTELCPWRGRVLKGEVHDDNAWAVGGIEGQAGLFGTAGSVWMLLTEIMDAMLQKNSRVVRADIMKTFLQKRPGFTRVAGFDTPSGNPSSSGGYFSGASIGHLGFTGTSFWMDPETELIIILLTNRVHPTRENQKIAQFRPLLHDTVIRYLGDIST